MRPFLGGGGPVGESSVEWPIWLEWSEVMPWPTWEDIPKPDAEPTPSPAPLLVTDGPAPSIPCDATEYGDIGVIPTFDPIGGVSNSLAVRLRGTVWPIGCA